MESAETNVGHTGAIMINRARDIARDAHVAQEYGPGVPYIDHVLDVAKGVWHLGWKFEVVALLHDVVEDSDVTVSDIREEFGDIIACAVDALSRRADEAYFNDYMDRIKVNTIARHVKLADSMCNFDAPGKPELHDKYRRVIDELTAFEDKI